MGATNLIEVVLRTRKEGKGIQDAEKELGALDKKATTAGKSLDGFGKILGTAAIAAGVATAALFAFKKAMDMGREGAAAIQTAESFDYLLAKVGASTDLLDELRSASRGTVDDLTLMEGTTSLLAGTQGELATALANSTPKLMEIAKAANKLNPALGDTTFMYKSLALGVKRAQPLILDNLGLTIKVSEANEKYADALGKSAEALTSEEQKMALLEATLEAGSVMIDQVGGDTEAATDSFDKLSAAMKNVADEGKKKLVPTLSDVADGLLDIINATLLLDKNLEGLESMTLDTTNTYKQYVDAMLDGAVVMQAVSEDEAIAIRRHLLHGDSLVRLAKAGNLWAARLVSQAEKLNLMSQAEWNAAELAEKLEGALGGTAESVSVLQAKTRSLIDVQDDQALSTEEQEAALKELEKQIQNTRDAYEDYYGVIARGIVSHRDLGKEQKQAAKDYRVELKGINKEIRNVGSSVKLDFEESLPSPTSIRERAQMAGDAWDEWGLRLQDVIQNGVASPWTAALEEMGMQKPPDVGLAEWAADIKAQFYEGELPQLINDQATAWVENTGKMKQAQAEATAAYQTEVGIRKAALQEEKAALKAARAEELEAEKAARQRSTLELALNLAEQTGMLQKWSAQKFGPDFSQVADSADEVLGLLDAGMLEIDSGLTTLIAQSTGTVQTMLDTTGTAADTTQEQLDSLMSGEWTDERLAALSSLQEQTGAFGDTWTAEDGVLPMIQQGLADTETQAADTNFPGISEAGTTAGDDIQDKFLTPKTGVLPALEAGFSDVQDTAWKKFISGEKSVSKALDKLIHLADELLDHLHGIIKAIKKINKMGIPGGVPTGAAGGPGGFQPGPGATFTTTGPKQFGGWVFPGQRPSMVGEGGPEVFRPRVAGQVIPNHKVNNYNLTLNSAATSGGVIQDFAMMQALYG